MTTKTLKADLEKIIKKSRVKHTDENPPARLEGNYSYKGGFLWQEAPDSIGWPGTARVADFYAYSDGIYKVDIFMHEEYAVQEGVTHIPLADFCKYVRELSKKDRDWVLENIAELK